MEDLFDVMDLVGGFGGGGMGFGGGGGFFGAIGIIFEAVGHLLIPLLIVSGISLYVLSAFKWQLIGRKAGLQKDWMPFVPFARTVYKLSIVDEPVWRMFFKDGFVLYAGLLSWIIVAINDEWQTFAVVLVVLYALCYITYNIFFRYKYYTAHNIKPHLALSLLVPPVFPVLQVTDYLIAFSRLYPFTGEGTSRVIMDAVDVPQMKDSRGNVIPVTQAMKPSDRGAPWEAGSKPPPAASPVAAPAGGGAGSGAASITGMSGMYTGQTIPLVPNDEMIIGRDNAMCNLIVDQNAEKVSRRHCGVIFNPGQGVYMVTDYSSNGTFIDGGNRLVANMPTALRRGAIITLGNRENRFKLD